MKSDYDKAACVDWKTEHYEYSFEQDFELWLAVAQLIEYILILYIVARLLI